MQQHNLNISISARHMFLIKYNCHHMSVIFIFLFFKNKAIRAVFIVVINCNLTLKQSQSTLPAHANWYIRPKNSDYKGNNSPKLFYNEYIIFRKALPDAHLLILEFDRLLLIFWPGSS